MLRKVLLFACTLIFVWGDAHAAMPELADFKDCNGKPLVCYEYVAEIRTTQLASEDERLYIEREHALLDDWKAHRKHRLEALWAQYTLTWILLGVGILIVITGLVMSWLHMVYAFKGGSATDSSVEAGKSGFKLSSPVIGLFVFGASIWFFNVYIDKVYQLSVLPDEVKATAPPAAVDQAAEPDAAKDAKAKPPAAPGAKTGDSNAPKPAPQADANGAKPAKPGDTGTAKPAAPAT